jgi:hypothetical protein
MLEQIIQEVYAVHRDRYLYRELAEITQGADLPASVFFDVLGIWYGSTQTAAVRRQLDRTRKSVSLVRLLEDIARNREAMTRELHLAVWGPEWANEANANFDRFASSRAPDRIDVTGVEADIAQLDQIGEVVMRYVDEAIAHTARRPTHSPPSYGDLNAAIDTIGQLVTKYGSLLKAEILHQLEPVIQGDWKAPFRQPWIAADDEW